MLWAKASAKAGLSGLSPCEAAREALFNPNLQMMPDPLEEPLLKELNVSILDVLMYNFALLYCRKGRNSVVMYI